MTPNDAKKSIPSLFDYISLLALLCLIAAVQLHLFKSQQSYFVYSSGTTFKGTIVLFLKVIKQLKKPKRMLGGCLFSKYIAWDVIRLNNGHLRATVRIVQLCRGLKKVYTALVKLLETTMQISLCCHFRHVLSPTTRTFGLIAPYHTDLLDIENLGKKGLKEFFHSRTLGDWPHSLTGQMLSFFSHCLSSVLTSLGPELKEIQLWSRTLNHLIMIKHELT